MFVFQCMHFFGYHIRRIGWQHRAFCLKNNIPLVVISVYIMYRNAGFCFSGIGHCLMNVLSVHSFSSKFGE